MSFARFVRVGRQRLRSLLRSRETDAELERELAFHVEALAADKIANGVASADARRQARREIGNLTRIKEDCQDARRVGWIGDARQDIVYGVRLLRAQPGVTLAAIASLAIGIGLNVAALRGLDGALLGVLRLPDAERHLALQTISPSREVKGVSAIDFVAWRKQTDAFDLLAAALSTTHVVGADASGPAARVSGQGMTAGYFDAIGARPLMGRVFTREESRLIDPEPAVIISEQLWRRRFGADPGILSQHLRLDGIMRPIVGVMPADIAYRDLQVDLWHPMRLLPTPGTGSGRLLRVAARLKPSTSIVVAQQQLDAVAASVGREYGEGFAGWTVVMTPLDDARLGWSHRPLAILLGIATLVLVVACANVAGLLLARAAARHREIRLRLDLGASRGRLMRQWITEGLVLGGCGGVASLAVAWIGLRGLSILRPPPGAPMLAPIGLDWRTAAITAIVATVAGLTLGVAPAWIASARRRRWAAWPRARSIVTAIQIAVTLVVIVGSGLLLNSLVRISTRDLGFEPDNLATFEVIVPSTRRNVGAIRQRPYFEMTSDPAATLARFRDEFREVPNVLSVGASSFRAIDPFVIPRFDVSTDRGTATAVACAFVTPGYFATMRTPIRNGRDIGDADLADTPWVAVVNETAAARWWPGDNPIGKTIRVDTVPDDLPRIVVGVVADMPLRHGLPSEPVVYESYLQQPSRFIFPWVNLFGTMTFVVRYLPAEASAKAGDGPHAAVADGLGQAAARVDPNIPLAAVRRVTDGLAAGRAGLTGLVQLATVLAIATGVLAIVGIHGVVAYGVRRQTREIAVRMALGARASQVVSLVASRVAPVVAAGVVAGVVASLALGRFIGSYLWGIGPADPATYAAACAVIGLLALCACIVPTRRALEIDPTTALRVD